jgi:hypothetical protein
LDSASQLADRISEVAPQPTAAYVSPACDNGNLIQRIDELSRQVASLTVNRPRHRSHSRARRNTDEPSRREDGTAEPNLCWYHRHPVPSASRTTRQQTLMAADACTTTIGSLFITDRTSKDSW